MTRAAIALAFVLASSAVYAEPLTGKAARAALFVPVKAEVEVLAEAGLPEDHARALELVGVDQPYFGAIAIAPDEGLMSEATVAAANFHDTSAAAVTALAECNAKKASASNCIVAAYIRPAGWKDTGFSLSSDATAAFAEYDMKTGALAISVTTGAFGIAAGEGAGEAAKAACAAKNDKASDCSLVVEK